MNKKISMFSFFLLLVSMVLPCFALGEVNWQARNTIKTKQTPLDIQISADGKKTFILTEGGKLEIYGSNATIIDTIEVDPAINSISVDGSGSRVLMNNPKTNSVERITVEYIASFNNQGSPFMGNANAPIVLAVFSDFQ